MFKINKEIVFPIIQAVKIEKQKKAFKNLLKFGAFRRRFRVVKDYFCWSEYLNKTIMIPKDYIFDGASIPKILNGISNPTGVLFYGALPHDFGYDFHGLFLIEEKCDIYFQRFSKKELDTIFKTMCTQESGMKSASFTGTAALTLFGSFAWKRCRKNNKNLREICPHYFFKNLRKI